MIHKNGNRKTSVRTVSSCESKAAHARQFSATKKTVVNGFLYANLNNDMWGMFGVLFLDDKDYFVYETRKAFCRERIIDFLNEKGIALFDTASSIRRLQDNASDKFLEVVEATDVTALLRTQSRRLLGIYFRRSRHAALPNAFLITGIPIGIRQESDCLPDYVSGFANSFLNIYM